MLAAPAARPQERTRQHVLLSERLGPTRRTHGDLRMQQRRFLGRTRRARALPPQTQEPRHSLPRLLGDHLQYLRPHQGEHARKQPARAQLPPLPAAGRRRCSRGAQEARLAARHSRAEGRRAVVLAATVVQQGGDGGDRHGGQQPGLGRQLQLADEGPVGLREEGDRGPKRNAADAQSLYLITQHFLNKFSKGTYNKTICLVVC